MNLTPENTLFCILSFEGPDLYCQAGGLGVRVTHLAETLARRGFLTHLLFVGDPYLPGWEATHNGRLILHRWCQWISAYHPAGVYAGEEDKLRDFNETVPPFLIEQIIRPAIQGGRMPVILAEEWHTAEALIRLSDQLHAAGLRQHCVLFWNANNTMSFNRLNWPRLNFVAQLTTVSRYMKHVMWDMGFNPLVIPNGIPAELLEPVDERQVAALRNILAPDPNTVMLFKVGRFDPAKRWLMAVEAVAQLKAEGRAGRPFRVVFPFRGGIEPHGQEVMARAGELGLSISHVTGNPTSWDEMLHLLRAAPPADLYSLEFFLSQAMLRPFYALADAVLANSGHEPFGLVGLEAMAAGGIVFTGATGEDYAMGGQSAVVLDTDQPREIVSHVLSFRAHPERAAAMRQAARERAATFTWEQVSETLLEKVAFVAAAYQHGVELIRPAPPRRAAPRQVRDVLLYLVVHQPRRLRLPTWTLPPGASPEFLAQALFDDALNERYFRQTAARCYYPATARFQALVEAGLKLAIGFTQPFIEQAQRWDPALLDFFRRLVSHPNVEPVVIEPTPCLITLRDIQVNCTAGSDCSYFTTRLRQAVAQIESIFGKRPQVADATRLVLSSPIYRAFEHGGAQTDERFRAVLLDCRSWGANWREPTYLYHHGSGQTKLLIRHPSLSDDVNIRFSNRSWDAWPLVADRYAGWLAGNPGDLVVLEWDFEIFGERHPAESGIFSFLDTLPEEVRRAGLSFITPSEAVARYGAQSYDLPIPASTDSWGSDDELDSFPGNDAQRAVFRLMLQAYQKAQRIGDPALVELALWLARSDNLHFVQWPGRAGGDGEPSAHLIPWEWWSLGPDGIVREVQQVYKNFIEVLDSYGVGGRE